eukprot:120867-Karenia_brevis.AAC.1
MWGMNLAPLTVEKVFALGATLKAGGYRSAALHFSAARVECERKDQFVSASVQRAITDSIRSCERGMGPAKKASSSPMDRFSELPEGAAPWVNGGPVGPKHAVICGSWWMLREAELSCTRASSLQFVGDGRRL